jgi:CRISPR-associated protein Cas1
MSVNRIVEVSSPAHLKTSNKQLVVEKEGQVVGSIPFEDLQAVILTHPQITVSIAVLQQSLEFNIPVIVCNSKHLPTGFLHAPLTNSLHSKIIRHQAGAKLPLQKQLWKTLVSSKIKHQAEVLLAKGKNGDPLPRLAQMVRSGDPDNLEAQAASVYWRKLFGVDFRRNPDGDGINALLNYGYSILRASTARALAGSGLNTTLGIFHRNQYNHFCLADDLMEIARPLVDVSVYEMSENKTPDITPKSKKKLLGIVNTEVAMSGETYYLTHALQRSAKSLADALVEGNSELFKPFKLLL